MPVGWPWFERVFAYPWPASKAPEIVERLRGTPARLEERLRDVPAARLVQRDEDRWSMQENAGHLLDLEPLWDGRVDDFLAGVETMRAADLTNRKTHEADHNAAELATILAGFREARERLVARLDAFDGDAFDRTALHPRLRQPMRLVDLAFFVAEHDDFHLARIGELLRGAGA